MDIYTAFIFGVLVGQWLLLFAIWRAIVKLVQLLNNLEAVERSHNRWRERIPDIELIEDPQIKDRDGFEP